FRRSAGNLCQRIHAAIARRDGVARSADVARPETRARHAARNRCGNGRPHDRDLRAACRSGAHGRTVPLCRAGHGTQLRDGDQTMSNANARLSKAATLPFLLSAMTTHAAPQIPLCPGLKIVTAVSQSAGDYESIKTIESVSPTEVKLKYTSEAPDRGLFASSSGETIKTTVYRRILTADLRAANLYMQVFDKDADELLPRTTAIGTSSAVLAALKTKGEATMSISNASAGAPMKADENLKPNVYDYFTPGTLKK